MHSILQTNGVIASQQPSEQQMDHQMSLLSQTTGESTWIMVGGWIMWLSHDCHVITIADGEWVKVDEIHVGLKGSRNFFETNDFLVDPAAPTNLVVQLGIKISGKISYCGAFQFIVKSDFNHVLSVCVQRRGQTPGQNEEELTTPYHSHCTVKWPLKTRRKELLLWGLNRWALDSASDL